jgi:hypothetical protein
MCKRSDELLVFLWLEKANPHSWRDIRIHGKKIQSARKSHLQTIHSLLSIIHSLLYQWMVDIICKRTFESFVSRDKRRSFAKRYRDRYGFSHKEKNADKNFQKNPHLSVL